MSDDHELRRISAAYERRDAGGPADVYTWLHPPYAAFMQQLEHGVLAALRATGLPLSASSALDIGCGTGYYTHRLFDYGIGEVHGVDLMEHRIAAARERYPGIDFRQASGSELPFSDGSIDIVTQFTCLSSILDPGVRRGVAAEIWRVLRPGGSVISFDMRPAPRALELTRRIRGGRSGNQDGTPVRPLPRQEIAELFPGQMLMDTAPTLHPALIAAVRARPLVTQLLTAVRPLRSHLLAVVRKDPA